MASKEPSSPSSSTSFTNYDWEVLENNINKKEIDAYIETNIPRSHVNQSNKNVKCHFCVETLNIVNHKLRRQHRKCKDGIICSVIYRVNYCEQKMLDESNRMESTRMN